MKKQFAVLSTTIVALSIAIFTLCSFIRVKVKKRFVEEVPPNNMQYNSTNKQNSSNQNITLSSSFYNDYYTNKNKQGTYYAEIKVDDFIANNERPRTPLNIAIVIDRSGSMAGEKINNVKKAAKTIVDNLNENDYLSVVIYDNEVTVLLETAHVYNKQTLKNKIDNIVDRGGTNLAGGMQKGYQQVLQNYQNGYINRVLLLSDGLANEGITNPAEIEKIVRNQNRNNGISISTFGVGADYNENLMTAMAENGTGNYYFINNAQDITTIFTKELNGLMNAVALNSVLQITLPANVNIDKIYGYAYEQIGRKVNIHFRDIFANETKGVLIKYTIVDNVNTPINFIANMQYTNANNKQVEALHNQNTQEFTTDYATYTSHFNEWVEAKLTIQESNDRLETAMQETDKGNYKKAKEIVQQNDNYIKAKPKSIQQMPAVQKATIANTSYADEMKTVDKKSIEEVKTMQKSNKNESYLIRNNKK